MRAKVKKDWFDKEKSAEELHNDSKLWISELNFINDELRFLNHVLSFNYLDFIDSNLSEKIDSFIKTIIEDKKVLKTLKKTIQKHEKILSDLIKKVSATSNPHFLQQHKEIYIFVSNHYDKHKKFKKNIFSAIEIIMRKKKQKKLG